MGEKTVGGQKVANYQEAGEQDLRQEAQKRGVVLQGDETREALAQKLEQDDSEQQSQGSPESSGS